MNVLRPSSPAARAALLTLPWFVLMLAVAVWNPAGHFWPGLEAPKAQCEAYDAERLRHAVKLDDGIYAPEKIDRLIREPQNTVSNLAYVWIGLAVVLAARRPLSRSFGVAAVFLGIGSGLYHASLLPEWRLLDILGVYAVLFSLIATGAGALLGRVSARGETVVAALAWLAAVAAGIHRNDVRFGRFKPLDSTWVVVAGIALVSLFALLALARSQHRRHSAVALLTIAIAAPLACFGGLADRFGGLLAHPDAWIQGHAVWHTLGAIGLLAAYEAFAATGYDRSTARGGNFGPAAGPVTRDH